MSLFKVAVTYETKRGERHRVTAVLCATDQEAAAKDAHQCVRACSADGVESIIATVVTHNSLGVEFIGRQPA